MLDHPKREVGNRFGRAPKHHPMDVGGLPAAVPRHLQAILQRLSHLAVHRRTRGRSVALGSQHHHVVVEPGHVIGLRRHGRVVQQQANIVLRVVVRAR